MKNKNVLCGLPIFLATLFVPMMVWANTLHISDVVVPDEGTPAGNAEVQVYFSLRNNDNMPVDSVNADNCHVYIDDINPDIKKAEIKPFIDGNKGVAVLFVFPVAKNYPEESFGIRKNLKLLTQQMNRPVDLISAITYDKTSTTTEWKPASESVLSNALDEMKNSDVEEPNFFNTVNSTINMLKDVTNVSQKYLVIISDANGAIIDEPERAAKHTSLFTEELNKLQITPIVIGYNPGGSKAMANVDIIRRVAANSNTNGVYFQAEDLDTFQKIIQESVYDIIFKQYIYQATLDTSGNNYLEAGKHNFMLSVNVDSDETKAAAKVDWPELSKFCPITIAIGIVSALVIIGGILFFVLRKKKNADTNKKENNDVTESKEEKDTNNEKSEAEVKSEEKSEAEK